MKKLLLRRGLPGSGKSTLAKADIASGEYDVHLEADQFFTDPDGNYLFDGARLGEAHANVQFDAFVAMAHGKNVVISNTFSQKWEMQLYLTLAIYFGYEIAIIDLFDGGFTDEQLAARCVHGCPEFRIGMMRERWEE